MEELIYHTRPSTLAFLKFWIIRIIAVAAVVFSVYSFNENNIFFFILIVTSAAVFLLCGSKQISIYKAHINIHTKSILKNTPFSRKFLLKDIKEISAELPGYNAALIAKYPSDSPIHPEFFSPSEIYNLSVRFRLVIISKDDMQRTFWIMTTKEDIQKSVSLVNEMIK